MLIGLLLLLHSCRSCAELCGIGCGTVTDPSGSAVVAPVTSPSMVANQRQLAGHDGTEWERIRFSRYVGVYEGLSKRGDQRVLGQEVEVHVSTARSERQTGMGASNEVVTVEAETLGANHKRLKSARLRRSRRSELPEGRELHGLTNCPPGVPPTTDSVEG